MRWNSVYVRLVIYMFTQIAALVLLGSAAYYFNVQNQVYDEVERNNEMIVRQLAASYEVFLDSTIKAAMVSIEDHPSHPLLEDGHHRIYDQMNRILKLSDFIHSVYYYKPGSESVFISSGFHFEMDEFYDRQWLESLELSDNLLILSARNLPLLPAGEKTVIPIVLNFPLNTQQTIESYILNIDVHRLFSHLIRNANLEQGRHFMIMDPSGMIFVSTDHANYIFKHIDEFGDVYSPEILTDAEGSFITEISGIKTLVSYLRSESYGWTYISELNIESVAQNMIKPLKIIALVAFAALLLSIIMVTKLSQKLYKPLADILSTLGVKDKTWETDEYKIISKHIHNYMRENKNLKETLQQQYDTMKRHFITQLIMRNIYNEHEALEKMAFFQIEPSDDYTVLVISLDDYEQFTKKFSLRDRLLWEYAIKNIVLELVGERYSKQFIGLESSKFALLIGRSNEAPKENLEAEMIKLSKEIQQAIRRYLKLSVSIGIGRFHSKCSHIHRSYMEAVSALKYAETIDVGMIASFGKVRQVGNRMEYDTELEEKMMKELSLGNPEEAAKLLPELLHMNLERGIIPFPQKQLFAFQLLNTLNHKIYEWNITDLDIFESNRMTEIYKQLIHAQNDNTLTETLRELILATGTYIRNRREHAGNRHVQRMLAYIHKHYAEPISVDMVSEHAGLNRVYASRLFKQHVNQNMSDYINLYRIEQAEKLMKETDMKIKDIAQQVGFNNPHYFIKVYKKYRNETPGQSKERWAAKLE